MEQDQNNVWVSKEEYERLRQAASSMGTLQPQAAQVTAGGTLLKTAGEPFATTRLIQKSSGIVAAISILLLLTGIGGDAILPILALCLGFSLPILLISSLALVTKTASLGTPQPSAVHTPSLQQLPTRRWHKPRSVAGTIGMALLALVAIPFFFFGGMIVLLFVYLGLGGDIDVGS